MPENFYGVSAWTPRVIPVADASEFIPARRSWECEGRGGGGGNGGCWIAQASSTLCWREALVKDAVVHRAALHLHSGANSEAEGVGKSSAVALAAVRVPLPGSSNFLVFVVSSIGRLEVFSAGFGSSAGDSMAAVRQIGSWEMHSGAPNAKGLACRVDENVPIAALAYLGTRADAAQAGKCSSLAQLVRIITCLDPGVLEEFDVLIASNSGGGDGDDDHGGGGGGGGKAPAAAAAAAVVNRKSTNAAAPTALLAVARTLSMRLRNGCKAHDYHAVAQLRYVPGAPDFTGEPMLGVLYTAQESHLDSPTSHWALAQLSRNDAAAKPKPSARSTRGNDDDGRAGGETEVGRVAGAGAALQSPLRAAGGAVLQGPWSVETLATHRTQFFVLSLPKSGVPARTSSPPPPLPPPDDAPLTVVAFITQSRAAARAPGGGGGGGGRGGSGGVNGHVGGRGAGSWGGAPVQLLLVGERGPLGAFAIPPSFKCGQIVAGAAVPLMLGVSERAGAQEGRVGGLDQQQRQRGWLFTFVDEHGLLIAIEALVCHTAGMVGAPRASSGASGDRRSQIFFQLDGAATTLPRCPATAPWAFCPAAMRTSLGTITASLAAAGASVSDSPHHATTKSTAATFCLTLATPVGSVVDVELHYMQGSPNGNEDPQFRVNNVRGVAERPSPSEECFAAFSNGLMPGMCCRIDSPSAVAPRPSPYMMKDGSLSVNAAAHECSGVVGAAVGCGSGGGGGSARVAACAVGAFPSFSSSPEHSTDLVVFSMDASGTARLEAFAAPSDSGMGPNLLTPTRALAELNVVSALSSMLHFSSVDGGSGNDESAGAPIASHGEESGASFATALLVSSQIQCVSRSNTAPSGPLVAADARFVISVACLRSAVAAEVAAPVSSCDALFVLVRCVATQLCSEGSSRQSSEAEGAPLEELLRGHVLIEDVVSVQDASPCLVMPPAEAVAAAAAAADVAGVTFAVTPRGLVDLGVQVAQTMALSLEGSLASGVDLLAPAERASLDGVSATLATRCGFHPCELPLLQEREAVRGLAAVAAAAAPTAACRLRLQRHPPQLPRDEGSWCDVVLTAWTCGRLEAWAAPSPTHHRPGCGSSCYSIAVSSPTAHVQTLLPLRGPYALLLTTSGTVLVLLLLLRPPASVNDGAEKGQQERLRGEINVSLVWQHPAGAGAPAISNVELGPLPVCPTDSSKSSEGFSVTAVFQDGCLLHFTVL